jgi:hypothetical protein
MWVSRVIGRLGLLAPFVVLSLLVPGAAAGGSAGTLNLTATLQLGFERVACPPGVPNDGRGCDHATGTRRIRGLGLVSVEELITFVGEAGARRVIGSGTLTVGARGSISFTFDGTARQADYTVTGGTGAYAEASGNGTILVTDVANPGQEHGPQQWSGTVTAPVTEFDTTPPQLSVGKPVVKRTSTRRYRIRIPFRASDNAGGPITYEFVLRGGTRSVRAAGTNATGVMVSVGTSRNARRLVSTLTVYDESANPTTRLVRIALPA